MEYHAIDWMHSKNKWHQNGAPIWSSVKQYVVGHRCLFYYPFSLSMCLSEQPQVFFIRVYD